MRCNVKRQPGGEYDCAHLPDRMTAAQVVEVASHLPQALEMLVFQGGSLPAHGTSHVRGWVLRVAWDLLAHLTHETTSVTNTHRKPWEAISQRNSPRTGNCTLPTDSTA